MKIDPAKAVVAYHAALERRDFQTVENCFAEAAGYQSLGLGHILGRAAIMAALRNYFAHNPNHAAQDENVVSTSDRSAESQWTLTTNGISRRGREIVRFDQFGKIIAITVEDFEP